MGLATDLSTGKGPYAQLTRLSSARTLTTRQRRKLEELVAELSVQHLTVPEREIYDAAAERLRTLS